MAFIDWCVVLAYALGMLAVGWYYARRTSTTDDYLLGGRNMSPWKVGLSLFASLLSTVTYLGIPGEMIKYGPMALAQLVALPFIALVVGWFLIPYIMRLRVTSAYEILETRLGLSVRMVGSCFFLILRLFWMSLVIFATADVVLAPVMGLDSSSVPWICVCPWGGDRALHLDGRAPGGRADRCHSNGHSSGWRHPDSDLHIG